jgi:hypothetical protein
MRVRRTKGHIRVGRSAVFSRIWTERVISLLLRVIASTMASFIDEYVIKKLIHQISSHQARRAAFKSCSVDGIVLSDFASDGGASHGQTA